MDHHLRLVDNRTIHSVVIRPAAGTGKMGGYYASCSCGWRSQLFMAWKSADNDAHGHVVQTLAVHGLA